MNIIITAPSLDMRENVSGISAMVNVIVTHNLQNSYAHFQLGKRDLDGRNVAWLCRTLTAYFRWAGILLKGPERLIHFNTSLETLALLRDAPLILAARLLRRRMVLHLHGGALSMDLDSSRLALRVLKVVLGGRDPIIVLSRAQQTALAQALNRAGLVVLPNCIDLTEARTFDRAYPTHEVPVLLFMGRISAAKGLDHIFDALKCLQQRGIPLRFIMAGAGPDEQRYVQSFRNLLGRSFEFRGVVSGKDKVALLKESTIFMLPSYFEGLPMALLESMSFGLVPVTTSVGSIGDVVTHGGTGMIVGRHSADEIVLAIEAMMADGSLRERLSRNARQFVFEHHGPDAYIARLNRIYQYE